MSANIVYPISFLERPEDRSFLVELKHAGVHPDTAKLLLYRIWADFATGGSDRRAIHESNIAKDRQVRVLEAFCDWQGESGLLVRMAVESGFLRIEIGPKGGMLVCAGFYPINSAWSAKGRSFQKKGAYTRVLNRHASMADEEAGKREELWKRTGGGIFHEVPESTRREAMRFIIRVCRTLGMDVPGDVVLHAGPFRMAIEHLQSTPEPKINDTLLWLLSRRGSPEIPDRLDAVLREWPEYVRRSAEELA